MQCPFHHDNRACMIKDKESLNDSGERSFLESHNDILPILVGASIPDFYFEDMAEIWKISVS